MLCFYERVILQKKKKHVWGKKHVHMDRMFSDMIIKSAILKQKVL